MAPPAEGADVAVRLFGGAAGGGAAAANNRIHSTRSQQAQKANRLRNHQLFVGNDARPFRDGGRCVGPYGLP